MELVLIRCRSCTHYPHCQSKWTKSCGGKDSYFKKYLRLFRQYCRVFCGTLFMYITLGTVSHLLKFSSILSSVFWLKRQVILGLTQKVFSFAILKPQDNYNLNSVSGMGDTNMDLSNRDMGFSCFLSWFQILLWILPIHTVQNYIWF